jgi:export-related chaperone CsaA
VAGIDDFAKLDIRIGSITGVEDVEKARKPLYKLTIDFGSEIGVRTILAGIKDFYGKDALMGRQIACIVNLDPKTIAGIESQGMILAADDENGLALMVPSKELSNGSRVH